MFTVAFNAKGRHIFLSLYSAVFLTLALGCGSGGSSSGGNPDPNTPVTTPSVPTALTAAPRDTQVVLNWTASTNATGYHVKRGTTHGGPYDTQVGALTATTYTDTTVTNNTT